MTPVSSHMDDALTQSLGDAPPMLRCEECRCVSETGKGWLAFIAEDPDDGEGPLVCTYCPPCAERELRPVRHAPGYA